MIRATNYFLLSCSFFISAAHAQPITEADLRANIEILASDDFQGRKPGTIGENRTINYIATQWAKAGLLPGAVDGSWYMPVTLVERTPQSQTARFGQSRDGTIRPVQFRADQLILRGAGQTQLLQAKSLVFAGYAPQLTQQLAAAVAGKIVFLPNSRPSGGDDLPDFEERKQQLIAAGAAAVIAIVESPNRWPGFSRFYRRVATELAQPKAHAEIEGLISYRGFRDLLRKTDFEAQALLADSAETGIIALPLEADMTAETVVRSYQSHNVIGRIAGRRPAAGAVLFLGHWDHFGLCRDADPADPDKDRICNGAVDNASGISLLIETAKRLAATRPDRDIYFLATTAEEKGLLGATAFAADPPTDLKRFVAAFNADTVALSDDGRRIAVIGRGLSEIDLDIEKVAQAENREIDQSGKADVFVRRQDGYALTRAGVPSFLISSAFADQERLNRFFSGRYHDVDDEADDQLILTGAAADANFHVALGRYFSSVSKYPGKATSRMGAE